jgi:hypothetical protein
MNEMERCEKAARLTTGGTSTAVASKSQITPLRKETYQWVERTMAGENYHHTCFQRSLLRLNVPSP